MHYLNNVPPNLCDAVRYRLTRLSRRKRKTKRRRGAAPAVARGGGPCLAANGKALPMEFAGFRVNFRPRHCYAAGPGSFGGGIANASPTHRRGRHTAGRQVCLVSVSDSVSVSAQCQRTAALQQHTQCPLNEYTAAAHSMPGRRRLRVCTLAETLRAAESRGIRIPCVWA